MCCLSAEGALGRFLVRARGFLLLTLSFLISPVTSYMFKLNGAGNSWGFRQQLSQGPILGSVILGETQEGGSWQGIG